MMILDIGFDSVEGDEKDTQRLRLWLHQSKSCDKWMGYEETSSMANAPMLTLEDKIFPLSQVADSTISVQSPAPSSGMTTVDEDTMWDEWKEWAMDAEDLLLSELPRTGFIDNATEPPKKKAADVEERGTDFVEDMINLTKDDQAPESAVDYRGTNTLDRKKLSQYYHLSRSEAARTLRVSITLLKRRCRRAGIKRWPYRKMRAIEQRKEKLRRSIFTEELAEGHRTQHISELRALNELMQIVREDPDTPLPQTLSQLT